MDCITIAHLLNDTLQLHAYHDVSNNGLQIENTGAVTRVMTAVDASLETFEAAVARGVQMVLVHHGLSWGNSLATITGLNRKLVGYAIEHNLAVYAAHLPLDAHPTLGNNAQLAHALGLTDLRPFMEYHGQKIGFAGNLPTPLTRDAFAERVREVVAPVRMERFDYGTEIVRTVGICSGGAPEGVEQAAREQLDIYLCGEANLVAYNLAKQLQINALFAGHYATERCGIRALGDWLHTQTGLPVDFLDLNLSY